MVLTAMVPLDGAGNLYQMVLNLPGAGLPLSGAMHGSAGSPVSTVAEELSLVSVKEFVVTLMALAKLSLAGAGAMTVIAWPFVFTGALVGTTLEIVGAPAITPKMSELLV